MLQVEIYDLFILAEILLVRNKGKNVTTENIW